MKNDNILIIAMLGAAAVMVLKGKQARTGGTVSTGGVLGSFKNLFNIAPDVSASMTGKEILDNGKPWANGWRYFSDGTTISPDGVYYSNGQQVYDPNNPNGANPSVYTSYDNVSVSPANPVWI